MQTLRTEVFLSCQGQFVHAGRLETTEDTKDFQRARFRYAASYLDRENAIPIDPVQLPLSLERRIADLPELFGGFADAYPDRFGEQIWMALEREAGVSGSYHTYLVSGSPDRIGALAFGPTPAAPCFDDPLQQEYTRRTEHDLGTLAEAAERFQTEGFHELPLPLRPFLSTGYSVGGSRPKALVTVRGVPMIAKFTMPRQDVWNEPRIEYAALTLARKLGLAVPDVDCQRLPRLSRSGNSLPDDVFLIRRFDRDEATGHRHHLISAKTLLAAHDFEQHSYQELALALARHAPRADIARSRTELFRRMVFNVLINNEDDHLKNHACLWQDGGFALSPLYDAVPSPTPTTSMQLSLGKDGTKRSLGNCLTAPEAFDLDQIEARAIVQAMADAFYETWETVFKDCGLEGKELGMLGRLFNPPLPL